MGWGVSVFGKVILALISLGLLATLPFTRNPDSARIPAIATLTDLPIESQYAISAAIVRDQSDYHAISRDSAWTAVNRAHDLQVDLNDEGVILRASTLEWKLGLRAWGYGERLIAAASVRPIAQANRIEYVRHDLIEWYVNGPLGLQQGFTLLAPPGERAGEFLALYLALPDQWMPQLESSRTRLTLIAPDGSAQLAYSGLIAFDADNKSLPAWLEIKDSRLVVRVDDRQARYPITVDPFVQQAKLAASDKASGDKLGVYVATSGDTVVVGAYESAPKV